MLDELELADRGKRAGRGRRNLGADPIAGQHGDAPWIGARHAQRPSDPDALGPGGGGTEFGPWR